MKAPVLTDADLRALSRLFVLAFIEGRMRPTDYDATVLVLAEARTARDRLAWLHADREAERALSTPVGGAR